MDELPDELLLRILTLVCNGPTLLDNIPLVCKRWHGLARDPAVWRDVDLVCCLHAPELEADVQDAARVLLHAPRLRSFELQHDCQYEVACYHPYGFEEEGLRRLSSALRRTRAVLCRGMLTVGLGVCGIGDLSSPLVGFLWRQQGHLRRLDMALDHTPRVTLLDDAEGRRTVTIYDTLAKLRKLESLRLVAPLYGLAIVPYVRELTVGLPELRKLDFAVDRKPNNCHAFEFPSRLAADLAVGSASSLRELELELYTDLGMGLEWLAALPRLERLVLRLRNMEWKDEFGYDDPACSEAFAKARLDEVVTVCDRVSPTLRKLVVTMRHYHLNVGAREFSEPINMFGERRPEVTQLGFGFDWD